MTLRPNRSMPAATVIPVLSYEDVPAAVSWLADAFGFVVRLRIGDHRVQMNVGDGAVVVARGARPPAAAGHSVMVRVTDVDRHCHVAEGFGAQVIARPQSMPYGERQYSVEDIGGHVWTFSMTEQDADPDDWGGVLA